MKCLVDLIACRSLDPICEDQCSCMSIAGLSGPDVFTDCHIYDIAGIMLNAGL